MSVIFGFRAFAEKNSTPVDSIEDWGKILTNDVFSQVPESYEYIQNNYGEPEDRLVDREKSIANLAQHDITESDVDFLMYTDSSAFDGDPSEYFFDAKDCYAKFIKFTDYIKVVNTTLCEECKKDIDDFAAFFLKHAEEGHIVQGYWS